MFAPLLKPGSRASAPSTKAKAPAAAIAQAQAAATGFAFKNVDILAPLQMREEPNRTGLPGGLKSGIERLSGLSLSDVRVHYNSPQPARLGALAFTRGPQIHVAPGAERHLPHEAWHVVQQKRGIVQPTRSIAQVPVNDDRSLEAEADRMGGLAARAPQQAASVQPRPNPPARGPAQLEGGTSTAWSALTVVGQVGAGLYKGKPTGSLTADLLAELIRSQLPEDAKAWMSTLLSRLVNLADQQYAAPAVRGLIAYITPEIVSSVVAWATPVLSAVKLTQTVLHLLPKPVQTLVLYLIARILRSFAAALEGSFLSGKQIETAIEFLFVDDPLQAIQNVQVWLTGLTTRPLAFLYEWYSAAPTQPVEPAPEKDMQKEAEKKIDSLASLDLGFLKFNVGQPKLVKGPPERKPEEASKESESPEPAFVPRHDSGGLVAPFTLSLSLFGATLNSAETNELLLPWSGGFSLIVPKMVLSVNAKVGDFFTLGAVTLEDLRVTDQGLQAIGFRLENLQFAQGVVDVKTVAGTWAKGRGFLLRGDVGVTAFDKEFMGRLVLQLGEDGSFRYANVVIGSISSFAIIPGVLILTGPKFQGKVAKGAQGTEFLAMFSGDIDLALRGVSLQTKQLTLGYVSGGAGEGGFEISSDLIALDVYGLRLTVEKPRYDRQAKAVKADSALLEFGKPQEESEQKEEAGWLSESTSGGPLDWASLLAVSPSIHFIVRNIVLRTSSPAFQMDRPEVAKISIRFLDLEAELDFLKKAGKLGGGLQYDVDLPFTVPFPLAVAPGVEPYVKFSVGAGIGGRLSAMGQRKETYWNVEGNAQLKGYIAVRLEVGVALGSQLLAAIAAGLFAEGRGEFGGEAGIKGGVLLEWAKIEPVKGDPMSAHYAVTARILAKGGLVISARLFLVKDFKLYERSFIEWELGKYTIKGSAKWTEKGWQRDVEEGAFDSGVKPPAHQDQLIDDRAETREILLRAHQAIVDGAGMRRHLVRDVVEEFLQKDKQVGARLDAASERLAELKSEKYELGRSFLAEWRKRGELKAKQKAIQEAEAMANELHKAYREIQLILIDAENVIDLVPKVSLEDGGFDLSDYLSDFYIRMAKEAAFINGTGILEQKVEKLIPTPTSTKEGK